MVGQRLLLAFALVLAKHTASADNAIIQISQSNDCLTETCMSSCANSYSVDYSSGSLQLYSKYTGTSCECGSGTGTYSTTYASGYLGDPFDLDFSAKRSGEDIVVTFDGCSVQYQVTSGCLLEAGSCYNSCLFVEGSGTFWGAWFVPVVVLFGVICGIGKGCTDCKRRCAKIDTGGNDVVAVVYQCNPRNPCCLMRCQACHFLLLSFQVLASLTVFVFACDYAATSYRSTTLEIFAFFPLPFAAWDAFWNASKMFDNMPAYFVRRHIASFALNCGVAVFSIMTAIGGQNYYRKYYTLDMSSCDSVNVVLSLFGLACSIALMVIQGLLCCKYRKEELSSIEDSSLTKSLMLGAVENSPETSA